MATEHPLAAGLREITKAEFFATVGAGDVHPRAVLATFKGRHFVSEWENRFRKRLGLSVSDSWGIEPTRYYGS